MNANSKGSVTPQMKEQIAAEATSPIAAFFFVVFAHLTIASAAPGTPNIIQGKKPDIYIPRLQDTSAAGLTSPEVLKISKSDGIKPEYVIQCMV